MSESFRTWMLVAVGVAATALFAGRDLWVSSINVDANFRPLSPQATLIKCRQCGGDMYLTTEPDSPDHFHRCERCGATQ